MNKVMLCGRLTKDPEIRRGENDQPSVARYSIAVDRYKEGADFVPCVAFGKSAEFAEKYLKKGTKILVEGHILTGSYTNKDGVKVYTVDVAVDRHEFVEPKSEGGSAPGPVPDEAGFISVPEGFEEDGLPFN